MSPPARPILRRLYGAGHRLGLVRPLLWMGAHHANSKRLMRRAFADWQPSASDVVVATFMKSGTNWMLQIGAQIAHRGAAEFEHIHDLVPWPDTPGPGPIGLDAPGPVASAPTGLRVIKTHGRADQVPIDPAARYIVVLRDPKDVLVSAYHFALPILGLYDRVDPAMWLKLFGSRGARDWAEHTAGWWAVRDAPNVLVLRFAEMKADLGAAVDRVAAHMGVALTPAQRAAVLERSHFRWMKANNHRFAPVVTPLYQPTALPDMVRRGAVGGGRELYPREALRRVDEAVLRHLERKGLTLPYRELFDSLA